MNKPLEAGQWCKPKDEKEWKAVLDLADALGVYTPGFRSPYESCECIWANTYGSINECSVTPSRLGETDPPLSVPDFISGMYALAERKGNRATETPRGPRGYFKNENPILDIEMNDIKARLRDLQSWRDKIIKAAQ